MNQANNVLEFPAKPDKIARRALPPEIRDGIADKKARNELGEYFTQNKKEYIDHVIDHYSTQLINKLGMHGFEIYEEEFVKRFSYSMEALRSTLYLSLDIYHPFKEHMDDIIENFDGDIETPDEFPDDDDPENA